MLWLLYTIYTTIYSNFANRIGLIHFQCVHVYIQAYREGDILTSFIEAIFFNYNFLVLKFYIYSIKCNIAMHIYIKHDFVHITSISILSGITQCWNDFLKHIQAYEQISAQQITQSICKIQSTKSKNTSLVKIAELL